MGRVYLFKSSNAFCNRIYFSVHYLRDGPLNDPVPEWMTEEEVDGEIIQKSPGEKDEWEDHNNEDQNKFHH